MGYQKYDYQVKPLGKRAYWPKANDPTKIVVKAFKDAVDASRVWKLQTFRETLTRNPKARPTIFTAGNATGYPGKPTYGATVMTPEQAENMPAGDNESDLKHLYQLAEDWATQATLDNTTNRIKMMLRMLGDVEVIEDENNANIYRLTYGHVVNVFKVKGQTLILIGDGHD